MDDYKELIDRLRSTEKYCGYGDCTQCKVSAETIETLLKELEAAMKDLREYGSCMICAHSCIYNNGEPCKLRLECYKEDCWEWRGPTN